MMERKKIDITPLVYVTLMIVVFLLGSCSTPKRVIPAAKYQKSTCCQSDTTLWNGLKISDYKSQGGFNYLEDVIKVFGKK